MFYLDKGKLCKGYRRPSEGLRRRSRYSDRKCVRWCSRDSWCKLQSLSRNCPRGRYIRNADSAGSSRILVHIVRRFCRKCLGDTCSDQSQRHRNYPRLRLRYNRKKHNPLGQSRKCLVHNGRSVFQRRLACSDSGLRSCRRADCASQLGYTRKLKIKKLWLRSYKKD